MGDTFITNMTHFIPDDSSFELPAPARRLADYLGDVVSAATLEGAHGCWLETPLRCRRRPKRRRCTGHLCVRLQHLPAEIRWHCQVCGDNGVITGWQGTEWDLSATSE